MKRLTMPQGIILIAVVVILIFVVSFSAQYLSGGRTPDQRPEPQGAGPLLTFHEKVAPGDPGNEAGVRELEWKAPGHYDFAFRNDRDVPVKLKLERLGCGRCTELALGLAPLDWSTLALDEIARRTPPGNVDWQTVQADSSDEFEVPAHAAGWARLGWDGKDPGPKTLSADLDVRARGAEAEACKLEVHAAFVPAVQADPQSAQLNDLNEGDERRLEFFCWSASRADFSLDPQPGANPCFVWGKPVRLSVEECNHEAATRKHRVLGAYRVPLTVHERLENGRQLDLGPFRHVAVLAVAGPADIDPVVVTVGGTVRGDVTVVNPGGRDRIEMGSFLAEVGIERADTVLESSLADLQLVPDESRTPDFLQAEVAKDAQDKTGKTWNLKVRVLPNRVAGLFPDSEKPLYRDCAVYLKMYRQTGAIAAQDKPWRTLRIPVSGNATFR